MKTLSKKELSELFVINRNCLHEINILLIFHESDKGGLSVDYTIRQKMLDYLNEAIQKYGNDVIDMGEKDQFMMAGISFGTYIAAEQLGLVYAEENKYKLDPEFRNVIIEHVINQPLVCDNTNGLIRDLILEDVRLL